MINDLSRFNHLQYNNNNNFEIIGRYIGTTSLACSSVDAVSIIAVIGTRRGAREGNRTDTRNNNHKLFNQII